MLATVMGSNILLILNLRDWLFIMFTGQSYAWAKYLLVNWKNDFNWFEIENQLNEYPHYLAWIEGVKIHFLHARAESTRAIPLLLIHGWSGSFYEFSRVWGPSWESQRSSISCCRAEHTGILLVWQTASRRVDSLGYCTNLWPADEEVRSQWIHGTMWWLGPFCWPGTWCQEYRFLQADSLQFRTKCPARTGPAHGPRECRDGSCWWLAWNPSWISYLQCDLGQVTGHFAWFSSANSTTHSLTPLALVSMITRLAFWCGLGRNVTKLLIHRSKSSHPGLKLFSQRLRCISLAIVSCRQCFATTSSDPATEFRFLLATALFSGIPSHPQNVQLNALITWFTIRVCSFLFFFFFHIWFCIQIKTNPRVLRTWRWWSFCCLRKSERHYTGFAWNRSGISRI